MNRFPILVVVVLLAWIGMAAGGCRGGESHQIESARIFRMNLGTEPPDLDPVKVTDLTSFTVIQNIMRGLTEIGNEGVKPAVAARWDVSPDGLTYTFYLRPDAVWSDGKPVTAQDFINGWKRALDPENGSNYVFFLFEIRNAKAYYEGKLKYTHQVGMKALGPKTLEVHLERPVAFFPELMASPVALPIRADSVARYGDTFTEAGHYVTNGPYLLSKWAHDEEILLTPNPRFFGAKPAVAGVKMVMVNDPNTSVIMYENNELDFIETSTSIPSFDVRRLRTFPEARTMPLHLITYLGFNVEKPPFDNPKVRQAFAYALDRSYYPRLMKSGQSPLSSWISPGLVGYNPDLGIKFNPEKARQLLAEAGYPDGKGFPPVTLGYRTLYDTQKEMEIAQFLWKKHLNVDVRLKNMEWKVFLSELNADPPNLFRLQWYVDYPDADSFMAMMIADSGNNHTRWKNPAYDQLVNEAAVVRDPAKRQALYDQAQRILLEQDAAMIPMYVSEKTFLVKPWVKGFQVNPLNLISLDNLSVDVAEKQARLAQ